jgi:hypothetical protein
VEKNVNRNIASSLRIIVAALAGLLAASCTREESPAAVPKPADPVSKEVVAYLAIPSLEKALKDISAVAEQFVPGKVTPETLKTQLGAVLNDPGLSGLELQKPIVICVFKASQPGAPPLFAGMLPVKQATPYDQSLTAFGMKSQFAGGVLSVSQTPEGLEAVAKAKGVYEQVVGAGLQKSARLYVQLTELMNAYGPLIDAQLDGLLNHFAATAASARRTAGAPMSPESLQTILKLELQGLLAIVKQCDAAQFDFQFGGQNIDVDEILTAKPGSALAGGFTSSARLPGCSANIIGGGFMTGALRCDPKGFEPLLRQVLEPMSKGSDGLFTDQAVSLLVEIGSWWGGSAAFGMRPGKEGSFILEYIMDVVDEVKYAETMEKALALTAPGTRLGNLYKEMGFEMKIEKSARQHAGVNVQRVTRSTTAPEKDAAAAAVPRPAYEDLWLKDFETAVVKGTSVASNESANLDRMIDQVLSSAGVKVPLESQKLFGAGCHAHMDYDFIATIKAFMSILPKDQAAMPLAMFDKLTSPALVLFAATFGDARVRQQVRVPLGPFAQIVKSAK